jgi:hypothetical protein
MKRNDRLWINGFGIALSEVYTSTGAIAAIHEAAAITGLDRDDFRAAGLDRYDLEHLRLAGVPTKKQAAAEARRQAARIRRELKKAVAQTDVIKAGIDAHMRAATVLR